MLALLSSILLYMHRALRHRSAELERANTRLTESLQQLQATQAQLLFSERVGQLESGLA